MDIPINAEVICSDGNFGRVTYIVFNPVSNEVTHLVVQENSLPHIERLVKIDYIQDSNHNQIMLDCHRDELRGMDAFLETDFIQAVEPEYSLPYDYPYSYSGEYVMWPYVEPEEGYVIVKHEKIPHDELAIRRGTEVQATDGIVGEVDEFLVDPETCQITHLVLREGQKWNKKDATIPITAINHISENMIYLKLTKNEVAELPTIPVRRKWA